MSSIMDTLKPSIEVLTPIIAFWGAALSTYIYVKKTMSDRIKMSVTYGWGYSELDTMIPEVLTLHAVNSCRRDVVVGSLTLEVPGLCRITPLFLDWDKSDEYEYSRGEKTSQNKYVDEDQRLRPGDRIEASFDYKELVNLLKNRGLKMPLRARAVFEDTLENVFFSSWLEIGKEPNRKTETD